MSACTSVPEVPGGAAPRLTPRPWSALPQWRERPVQPALEAFRKSCAATTSVARWKLHCERAAHVKDEAARDFFETWFTPHELSDGSGVATGLLTGYYEPLLRGARERKPPFLHPVHGVPEDLLQIEIATLYPGLDRQRVRGRLIGRKVIPYHSRREIDAGAVGTQGRELLWVDDPIALFFLQIQGSGKVDLDDGTRARLAYAEQNGHPYRAIGKVLIERGELRREEVTLQSIRAWLEKHPDKAAEVMQTNPSYVFFELLPDSPEGPKGAQGVPLTPGHSIAVDPGVIPLGTPVYLEARSPRDGTPLNRLTVAQDTGGAIRGAVRADLFLGAGSDAEELAGRMKQALRLWVLLPKGETLSAQPGSSAPLLPDQK